ncbi:unnamed protein product [Amoebophrya sp. A25]|nr:unnamed protein product [Amoebophrya sp. A25]|eukprot:GSA25T00015057001.1
MSARSEDVTDVDSIWAEMLAENKPARNTRSVSLVNFDAAIGTKKTTKKAKQFKLQGGYGSVGGSVELGDDKPAGGKKREQKAAVSGTAKQDATGQKERKPVLGSGGIASLMATTKSAIGAKKARETDFAWLQNYGVAATGSEDSSVKQGLEPQFEPIAENVPTDSADAFIAHLQRDINCLDSGNEVELKVRLRAVKKLELIFVKNHAELPSNILDVALEELTKPLLKRLQRDGSEKIREIATSVLRTLLEHAPKIDHSSLQFIVPILVSRLGSEDLDGVAHLPPVMRPNPEQRPVEIQKPVEESEEVRKQLALLIQAFATRISTQQVLGFIDELTGLLRALLMDSYAGVKMLGCETMTTFCYNHKDVLLHFTEPMGRSITSCLVHNHFRLRVAALQTLTAVLHCGTWKHNHEVVQHLVAWQDPNQVPIKSFYESHTTVNYFSSLTFDRHPAVRRFWFETLAFWLLRLPDHVDHEPHIFPYILSGLYDENEDIALETFWLLEACGAQYEIDNEKDLREKKQYGLDAEWTYKGKVIVPFPLQGRWRREIRKRTQPQGPDFQGVRAKQTRAIDLDEEDGTSPDKEDLVQLPQRDSTASTFRSDFQDPA